MSFRTTALSAAMIFTAASAPLLLAGTASAGSLLMPGITTGIPLGAAPPEGVYSISFPNYGSRDSDPSLDTTAIVPSWLVWSTPWTLAEGHIVLDAVIPWAQVNVDGGPTLSGWGNPAIDMQVKWDLGGGFFGGFQAGLYMPVHSEIARDGLSFQGVAALSYLKDGWDLSSTFIIGTANDGTDGGPAWLNVDLTATKKFGKFEIGAVAFGSSDLSTPYLGYERQSQFAAGGLIGYDFGVANVQIKLTRDLYQDNYGGAETRVWGNITIPLRLAADHR